MIRRRQLFGSRRGPGKPVDFGVDSSPDNDTLADAGRSHERRLAR